MGWASVIGMTFRRLKMEVADSFPATNTNLSIIVEIIPN